MWRKTWDEEAAAPSILEPHDIQATSISQKKTEGHRECFGWLKTIALPAQGTPSRNLDGGLAVYLRVRGLQPGAHAKISWLFRHRKSGA